MVRTAAIRETREVREESSASGPATLSGPGSHNDRVDCPRCAARLLFDGEKLACLMCGYEHSTPPRLRGHRSAGELLDALPLLRSDLACLLDSLGAEPRRGSPASCEFTGADTGELSALQFGRLFTQQSLVSAGHSLIALVRGLEPPAPEYGTWSIARAVLNSASLVSWMLETDIGRRERAARSLAVQLTDLEAECRFLASLLKHRGPHHGFADALAAIHSRRRELLVTAEKLGNVLSVPEPADRAAMLGAEFEYLMCSSILDGRPWALLHATAIQSGCDMDRASSILTTQVQLSASWYARAVWAYVSWMSPQSLDELRSSLEYGYDSLALADDIESRFWRSQPSRRETALAAS